MRQHRFVNRFIVILVFVFALPLWAERTGNSDQEVIQDLIAKCAQALQNQDWEKLESVCASDWIHISHMGDRWDMAAVKSFFEKHITNHTIEFANVDVHVSDDGSMAWATFNEQTEYEFDGKPVKQKAVFTAIFEEEEGDWAMKVLHRTTAPPPGEK